jgi:hypothetical protein
MGRFETLLVCRPGRAIMLRGEHAAAQFGAEQPCRLIGAEGELALQLQRRESAPARWVRLVRRGSILMSPGGQFFMPPDTAAIKKLYLESPSRHRTPRMHFHDCE